MSRARKTSALTLGMASMLAVGLALGTGMGWLVIVALLLAIIANFMVPYREVGCDD